MAMVVRKEEAINNIEYPKSVIAFVDTENISPHHGIGLMTLMDYTYKDYKSVGIWCYGMSDDKSGSSNVWKEKSEETSGYYKWKEVKGIREKNKVDEAIKKDIEMLLSYKKYDSIDIWVIATSDGDYESAVRHIKERGHKVVIAYSNYPSKKLIDLCDVEYQLFE